MEGAGHKFFTHTAFARNQDLGVRPRHPLDLLLELPHDDAAADQLRVTVTSHQVLVYSAEVLTNFGHPVRPLPQAFVQGGRQYLSSFQEPGSSQKARPVARLGDNSQKRHSSLQIEVCHLVEKSL